MKVLTTYFTIVILLFALVPFHSNAQAADFDNERAGGVAESFGALMAGILNGWFRYTGVSILPLPIEDFENPPDVAGGDWLLYYQGVGQVAITPLILFFFLPVLFGIPALCIYCCCCSKNDRPPINRWVTIGCMSFLYCGFIIAAVIAGGVDYGFGAAIEGGDGFGEYVLSQGEEILDISSESIGLVDSVFVEVIELNDLIFESLPTDLDIDGYIECVNDVFDIIDQGGGTLVGNLTFIRDTIQTTFDFDAILGIINDMQLSLDGFPDLLSLADQLDGLNVSISRLPDVNSMQTSINNLNTSIGNLNSFDFDLVVMDIETFDEATMNISTAGTSTVYGDINTAIDSMPDLDNLIFVLEDAPNRTTRSQLLGNLTALSDALGMFPTINTTTGVLDRLDSAVGSLNVTLNGPPNNPSDSLTGRISMLTMEIDNFENLTTISESLQGFVDFRDSDFDLGNISTAIMDVNSSVDSIIAIFPRIRTVVTDFNSSLNFLRGEALDNLINELTVFNNSLGGILCVDDILQQLEDINSTLIHLPSSVGEIFNLWDDVGSQLEENITDIQLSVTEGVNEILNIQDSLNNVTEIDDLLVQVDNANESLAELPEFDGFIDDIDTVNGSLDELDDIESYQMDINMISSSLEFDELSEMQSALSNASTSLNDIPDIREQSMFISDLDGDSNAVEEPLQNTRDALNALPPGESVPSGGGFDTFYANLRASIITLRDTLNSGPDRDAFLMSITDLENSLADSPDSSTLTSSIRDVESSISGIDDLNPLSMQLDELEDSLNNLPDLSMFANDLREYDANNQVLRNDLDTSESNVEGYQTTVDSLDLNSTIESVEGLSDTDTSFRSDVTDNLENIKDFRSDAPDLESLVSDVQVQLDDAQVQISNMSSDIGLYRTMKDEYVETAHEYEAQASSGVVAVAVLPIVLSVFLLLTAITKIRCFACFTIFCYILLLPIYLIAATPLLAVSTVMADHCPTFEETMRAQINVILSDPNGPTNEIDFPEGITPLGLYDYYTSCVGEQPDFIDIALSVSGAGDEGAIASDGVDVGELIAEIEEMDIGENETISLADPLETQLYEVGDSVNVLLDGVSLNIADILSCDRTTVIFDFFVSIPCDYVLSLASSTALMLILFSIFMLFGIGIGIFFLIRLRVPKEGEESGNEDSISFVENDEEKSSSEDDAKEPEESRRESRSSSSLSSYKSKEASSLPSLANSSSRSTADDVELAALSGLGTAQATDAQHASAPEYSSADSQSSYDPPPPPDF